MGKTVYLVIERWWYKTRPIKDLNGLVKAN